MITLGDKEYKHCFFTFSLFVKSDLGDSESMKVEVLITQSYQTLCHPVDCGA